MGGSPTESEAGLASPDVFPGARVRQHDRQIEVFAPNAAWAQAIAIALPAVPKDPRIVGVRIIADVEVSEGVVGVFAMISNGTKAGTEVIVAAGAGRTAVALDVNAASSVCFRNGDSPSAKFVVYGVRVIYRRSFDLTRVMDDLLCSLLKEPGAPALASVAQAVSRQEGRVVAPEEIGTLTCDGPPNSMPFEELWRDEIGRRVLEDTLDLIALLPTYNPEAMDARNGYLGREFFASYLKQSVIRVYHCAKHLRERGIMRGAVLDVGSLFGQFAVSLQRLGYHVTAVDRYRTYHGALDGFVEFMRREGVTVVPTTREDESEAIAQLGRFDAVLAMAVIEHIPHTPRPFLEMLVSHVRPGRLMVLDTPNIARWWNRKRLAAGESIHQAIENQYYADIPFEGHHREYTRGELTWMLEQAGCCDVRSSLFDYNLLQFSELWPEHREALLAMTVDPTLADTILISGAARDRV